MTKIEDLRLLHRMLFMRPGRGNSIKHNIRKFAGFTCKKDDADYEKLKNRISK